MDISLDNGPVVYSTVINFGESKNIDIDVTNALRIKVTVTSKSANSCCTSEYLAIGNPRFA